MDVKRHTKEEHVQCYNCKYSGTPTGLKQYMKDVIVGVGHKLTCPIADCKYSGTIIGLKDHKKTKHGTKQFPCLYAGCNFSGTHFGLKDHRKMKHEVKCPLAKCKFFGKSLLALRNHTRAKHGPEVSGPPKNSLAKKGSKVGVFELGSGNCYCIVF